MANKFAFQYLTNRHSYFKVVCKVEGSEWKLIAGCEGDSDVVRVKMLNNVHNHTARDVADYHPVVCSKNIGNMIKYKIAETPSYLPTQIRKDIKLSYDVRMSYHQAWHAKEWAKSAITGHPKDSYKFVSWMCQHLRQ
uniref:Transposase MuDR plant domain-containing protein n=1 Tax=Davidia involucrata TaxID=16924 RepID=A0A5B7A5U7_DAVIN